MPSIKLKNGVLERIQKEYSLNDSELAAKIGIDYSMLWRIKAGRNRPGQQFVARMLNAFPELTFEDVFFLDVTSHGNQATGRGLQNGKRN